MAYYGTQLFVVNNVRYPSSDIGSGDQNLTDTYYGTHLFKVRPDQYPSSVIKTKTQPLKITDYVLATGDIFPNAPYSFIRKVEILDTSVYNLSMDSQGCIVYSRTDTVSDVSDLPEGNSVQDLKTVDPLPVGTEVYPDEMYVAMKKVRMSPAPVVSVYVDDKGCLRYRYSTNVNLDFRIQNGSLIASETRGDS